MVGDDAPLRVIQDSIQLLGYETLIFPFDKWNINNSRSKYFQWVSLNNFLLDQQEKCNISIIIFTELNVYYSCLGFHLSQNST